MYIYIFIFMYIDNGIDIYIYSILGVPLFGDPHVVCAR